MLAGMVAHKVAYAGWKAIKKEDPPDNPAAFDATWGTALAWSVSTGVMVGIAHLLARRGSVTLWKKFTGSRPPM